jgi:hypothetical protein
LAEIWLDNSSRHQAIPAHSGDCGFEFQSHAVDNAPSQDPEKGARRSGCLACPRRRLVAASTLNQADWLKSVLFDRGYLARIRGDAIKVYLAVLDACGGLPDRSVTVSLAQLMAQTQLSCPTVIESLTRLEQLGLVVSTTRQRGKVKTYYVSDPPASQAP